MPPKTTAKKGSKKPEVDPVQELLDQKDAILRQVDEAAIFKTSKARTVPTFDRSEAKFGPVLGVGGFCVVREVRELKADHMESGVALHEPSRANVPEEEHYDPATAKQRMSKYCLRDGDARYAVKILHKDLSDVEFTRGMIDLEIEKKYLSVVSHPNIIKMRAIAACGPMNEGYFLVLDRLYGTLEEKIEEWKGEKKAKGGLFGKIGAKKDDLKDLVLDRLLAAYDLSSAFRYLHENKLVYRDIKAENIGFDVRGDAKVFDFGLCKSLDPKLRVSEDLYKFTGLTGSFPYMAPEVALKKPYGTAADTFSFSILVWEMLALQLPFKGATRKEYYQLISVKGDRPLVKKSWPKSTVDMMVKAWDANPKKRPDFKSVGEMIKVDLKALGGGGQEIDNREQMMRRKSMKSFAMRDGKPLLNEAKANKPTAAKPEPRRASMKRRASAKEMHGADDELES